MGLLGSIVKGIAGAGVGFLTGGPAGAVAGGISGLTSGMVAGGNKKAIDAATQAQLSLQERAIGLQERQAETDQANFAPWLSGGQSALAAQMGLLGLDWAPQQGGSGAPDYAAYVSANPDLLADYQRNPAKWGSLENYGKQHYQTFGQAEGRTLPQGAATQFADIPSQQASIDALKGSPLYESLYRAGLDANLNNLSATGGLRGGDARTTLANFGRDTLAQVIQQQLANLGGIAGSGQSAAGSLSAAGQGSTNNITQLLGQQGQIQAGGILGKQAVNNNSTNSFLSGLGGMLGNGGAQNAIGALGKIF